MQILKKVIWTAVLLFSGAIGITYADIVYLLGHRKPHPTK